MSVILVFKKSSLKIKALEKYSLKNPSTLLVLENACHKPKNADSSLKTCLKIQEY